MPADGITLPLKKDFGTSRGRLSDNATLFVGVRGRPTLMLPFGTT
jgi:hypothetical protein